MFVNYITMFLDSIGEFRTVCVSWRSWFKRNLMNWMRSVVLSWKTCWATQKFSRIFSCHLFVCTTMSMNVVGVWSLTIGGSFMTQWQIPSRGQFCRRSISWYVVNGYHNLAFRRCHQRAWRDWILLRSKAIPFYGCTVFLPNKDGCLSLAILHMKLVIQDPKKNFGSAFRWVCSSFHWLQVLHLGMWIRLTSGQSSDQVNQWLHVNPQKHSVVRHGTFVPLGFQ